VSISAANSAPRPREWSILAAQVRLDWVTPTTPPQPKAHSVVDDQRPRGDLREVTQRHGGYYTYAFHDDEQVARTLTNVCSDAAIAMASSTWPKASRTPNLDGARLHIVHGDIGQGGDLLANIRRHARLGPLPVGREVFETDVPVANVGSIRPPRRADRTEVQTCSLAMPSVLSSRRPSRGGRRMLRLAQRSTPAASRALSLRGS
jgi:hypothetical protein